MATIDGRLLDLSVPGGVVFLEDAARRDWTEQLEDGVTAETAEGSRAVVLRGLSTSAGVGALLGEARRSGNEALDLMAIRSLGCHSLREVDSPAIAWTVVEGRVCMRSTSFVHSTMTLSAGGPPSPGPVAWHPCMRFFRLSQTTTDLFDAFRNLYLAFESILSTVEPVRHRVSGRPEQEGLWLRRALASAEQRLLAANEAYRLGWFLDPPSDATGEAGVDAVMDDLYSGVRTTVFHSKDGREVALPQREPDRPRVAEALSRYSRFFLQLAEVELGARFLSGGIGQGLVDTLADGVMTRFTVGLSDRVLDLDGFDEAAAASLTLMATGRAPELDSPFSAAVRGVLAGEEVPSAMVVRSFGVTVDDGQPATVEALGGDLVVDGVDVWEHVLVSRVRGGSLKWNYAS